jgi:hypothetical protein
MLPSHVLPPCEHPLAYRHAQSESLQSNGRPTQPISDSTDESCTQNSSDSQSAHTSTGPPDPVLELLLVLVLVLELLLLLLVVLELLLPQVSIASHEVALTTHALTSPDSMEQTLLQFGGTCPHCVPIAVQTSEQDTAFELPPAPPDAGPSFESPPAPSFESPLHATSRNERNKPPRSGPRMFMQRS